MTDETKMTPMEVADAVRQEAEMIESLVLAFSIATAEDFTEANNELQAIKKKAREIENKRQELKAPVLEAGRKIDEMFKPALAVLKKAEDAIKKQMIDWQREQERIRKEREEAARKELEKAERARTKAMERGDVEKVAKLEEKVVSIAAGVAEIPPTPEAKGFCIIEVWSASVVDLMALVKAVAAGKQPLSLLCANQGELDDLAKAHKDKLAIPGVLAVQKDTAGSRSK